jgi:DNA-directed RNA polymerase subunit RPC12/RpoP
MATQFKCDKCGKMLSVGEAPGTMVVCPHCRSAVLVPSLGPAGVAMAPQRPPARPMPGVKPGAAPPPGMQPPLPEEEPDNEGALVSIMGAIMPWAVSVVFHFGLILVALFIAFGIEGEKTEPPVIPDAELSADPGAMSPSMSEKSREKTSRVRERKYQVSDTRLNRPSNKPKAIVMIGVGTEGGSSVPIGDAYSGGPSTGFFGTSGNARRVVYVVDRSGSMFDTFDYVRAEMKTSISRLKPIQDFHVIFFAAGTPEENPPKMMVPATGSYKKQAYDYLGGIVAEGQTKPKQAIERAFAVTNKQGLHAQLVYLLTDGEFDPEIVKQIDQMQSKLQTKIKINTIGFIYRSGEKILKQIAEENGGTYQFVSRDDLGR